MAVAFLPLAFPAAAGPWTGAGRRGAADGRAAALAPPARRPAVGSPVGGGVGAHARGSTPSRPRPAGGGVTMKARVSPAKAKAKAKAAAAAAGNRGGGSGGGGGGARGATRKRGPARRAAGSTPQSTVDAAGRPLTPYIIGGKPEWKARLEADNLTDWIDLDSLRPGDELRAVVLPSPPSRTPPPSPPSPSPPPQAAEGVGDGDGPDADAAAGTAVHAPAGATASVAPVDTADGGSALTPRHDAHAVYLSVPVFRHGRRGTPVPVHARLRHTPPRVTAGGRVSRDRHAAAAATSPAATRLPADVATAGRALRVVVASTQPAAGRLEVLRVRDARAAAGRTAAMAARRAADAGVTAVLPPATALADLAVGDALPPTAVVVGVTAKGARIDAGVWRPGKRRGADEAPAVPVFGYLQRRRFPRGVASAMDGSVRDDALAVWGVGDELGPAATVYVRGVHPDSGLLFLDGSPVSAESVAEEQRARKAKIARWQRRTAAEERLSVGLLVVGVVVVVTRYGAFVDVGVKRDLLVHWSRMGERHKGDWRSLLTVGTEVLVTVTGVGGRGENAAELVCTAAEAAADAAEAAAEAASPTAMATRRAPPPTPVRLLDTQDVATRKGGGAATATAAGSAANEEDDDDSEDDSDSDGDSKGLDRFDDDYFEARYG